MTPCCLISINKIYLCDIDNLPWTSLTMKHLAHYWIISKDESQEISETQPTWHLFIKVRWQHLFSGLMWNIILLDSGGISILQCVVWRVLCERDGKHPVAAHCSHGFHSKNASSFQYTAITKQNIWKQLLFQDGEVWSPRWVQDFWDGAQVTVSTQWQAGHALPSYRSWFSYYSFLRLPTEQIVCILNLSSKFTQRNLYQDGDKITLIMKHENSSEGSIYPISDEKLAGSIRQTERPQLLRASPMENEMRIYIIPPACRTQSSNRNYRVLESATFHLLPL